MTTDDPAVLRTVSAVSATSAASDNAAVVNESLEGLCSAVDELKKSMGLGNQVDFAAVEEFVQRLRQENEEFRQYAEQAILSAQRLRDERDELQARLDQSTLEATMGAALAETQKLKDVAEEFEKDLYETKLADAEARAAEAEGLRERIAELEEENAGLTQTLNEFRATTQQLQRLQSHEVRRLQAVEAGAAARAAVPALASTREEAPAANGAAASPGSSPAGGATPRGSPRGAPPSSPPAPSAEGAAASRIAAQLEEVAGGANSGLLAEAALALRELSKRDAALQEAERELGRLRGEVEELNDTMFSKTFKPPSAWAEREIKYKSEKKFWEEQQKEVAARLAALAAELEAYRGVGKAHQLEGRIQDLEARLLQSERERDSARAALHELQLSMRTEGEFGAGGRRLSPYKGPLGAAAREGHEVAQLVERLDGGGVGIQSPGAASLAAAAERVQGMQAQLDAAATENLHLRRRLLDETAVAVPPSLHRELGASAPAAAVLAAAAELEAKLAAAEAESAALRQQLGSGDANATAGAAEQAAAALEARAAAADADGNSSEAESLRQQAAQLGQLGAALRAAEEEQATLRAALADLAPVRLQLSAAAASEPVEVPPALQPELGPTAPAATVAAKAAELEARLGDAETAAGDLHHAARLSLAAEAAAAAAAAAQQGASAALAAAGTAGEAEQLRRELAAAQRQKEAALQQLWEVAELQEQLQRAEGERRRLAAALLAAAPVTLRLAAGEAEGAALEVQQLPEEGGEGGGADMAQLQAELQAAEQQSGELRARLAAMQPAAPVALSLQLDGGDGGGAGETAERLAAAEAEAALLRAQLADLAPIRLQLQLDQQASGGGGDAVSPASPAAAAGLESAAASPLPPALASLGDLGLTAERSSLSLQSLPPYSSEQASALSRERAAADEALREYQKSTDVPALLRTKAELETRCQMLEAQLAKMQSELATVDEVNAVMEDTLDSALRTGDVSALDSLKERLSRGTRMFRRPGKAPSPSKDSLKNTVHEMQDALTSSEEERNALKRQLAKLSKKYQQVTQQQAHTAGIVAGAAAALQGAEGSPSADGSLEPFPGPDGADDDEELEMLKMREENQMLMEHVVMVKVRQAEMEGEYLEARRQLARTREKNMQLLKKLSEVREAAEKGEPLPLTPKGAPSGTLTTPRAALPADSAGDVGQASQPMRKGLIRIPGL